MEEKTVWLLEWPVPWGIGHGFDRHHLVFLDKSKALENGCQKVRETFSDDTPVRQEKSVCIFQHVRADGGYFCGGVSLKAVPLIGT